MISCASISSGTFSLPRSGSLPSAFAAAMHRVGEADLARRDLQDLLQRERRASPASGRSADRRTDRAGGSRRGRWTLRSSIFAGAFAGGMPACMKMLPPTSVTIGLPRSQAPYLPRGAKRFLVFDVARRMRRQPRLARLRVDARAPARPSPSSAAASFA